MGSRVLVLLLLSGCISIGGGTALNVGIDDSPVRRVGGSYEIGNLVEIVEDRLVGQLFFARDLGPLGARSEALGAWGGRLSSTQGHGLPGLYVQGAYGQNDDIDQSYARLVMIGAGVAYARHDAKARGRIWTALRTGLVYHRQHQLTTNGGEVGHFLGLEITVNVGYDVLGPMFTSD
ncbi:MAG: hypothetical protein AB7T06_27735 [Kofleriaceae bacterium]